MALDPQRLERSTQSIHGMAMSLGSLVMGAIAADKALVSVDFGDLARMFMLASLGCFAVTALVGVQLMARLPMIEGEIDEVMSHTSPLFGAGGHGVLHMSVRTYRAIQHWGMLLALLFGLGGVLAISTAESLPHPAGHAPAAVEAQTHSAGAQ